MGLLDDMADELARQTLEITDVTGDVDTERELAGILGTSSQTLEEAYLTAMRVRKAERRARAMLAEKRKEAGLPPFKAASAPQASVKAPDTSA